METASFTRTSLHMFWGVIVWAAHFAAIYGFTALACARGYADAAWLGISIVSGTIIAATLVALALALAFVIVDLRSGLGPFEKWMSVCVGALASLAIAWEGLVPVWIVPLCT